jgi:uncharacterized protein YeeX (DUF496 family)
MTDNPLQKHVDAIDNPQEYVQPNISVDEGQYLLKALDYLAIRAEEYVERPIHDELEEKMTDIILEAPNG